MSEEPLPNLRVPEVLEPSETIVPSTSDLEHICPLVRDIDAWKIKQQEQHDKLVEETGAVLEKLDEKLSVVHYALTKLIETLVQQGSLSLPTKPLPQPSEDASDPCAPAHEEQVEMCEAKTME